MSENTKTLLFVLTAVVILLISWVAQPTLLREEPEEVIGQLLVKEFDPSTAASLEIMRYDEKEARIETFEVAHDKQKGVWSIPSHDNYPADAKEHLAEAATSLLGVKILQLVTQKPGDHKEFGVLEPNPNDPREGMGMRVIMKDQKGDQLLGLIIGKETPDRPELRYVRRLGQDAVFVAEVKTDKLSTRFEDWIEKDLLKLNPWDIKEVEIRDYSVDIVRGAIIQRGQMSLEYNDTADPRWKLVQDIQATEKGLQPVSLGPEEELNTAKLDDMKFALDDLKIVDVNPKPSGLSADLKAEKTLIDNRAAVANLAARGFYPAQVEDRYEIVSNEGEIRVLMKDGVEYLLRFGGPAGAGKAEESKKETASSKPAEKPKEENQKASPGMNRFIMVTARFNESAIPKPQLEPLPEESAEKAEPEAKVESKPSEKPSGASAEKSKPSSEKTSPNPQEKTGKEKAEPKKNPEEAKKELEKRRQEIQKENERKQKEYQEKLEQGRKKAKELNDRFADWYYIISEETYKKIHLSRNDIVKKKEKEKAEPEHKHDQEVPPKPATPSESPKAKEESKPEQPKPAESKPPEPKSADSPAAKPSDAPSKPQPAETPAGKTSG